MNAISRRSVAWTMLVAFVAGMNVQNVYAKNADSKTAIAKQKVTKAGKKTLSVAQSVAKTFMTQLKKNVKQNPYTSDKLSLGFDLPDALHQEITGIPFLESVFVDQKTQQEKKELSATYMLGFSGSGSIDHLLPTLQKGNIHLHPEVFNGKSADKLYGALSQATGKIDKNFQAFFKVVFPYPTVDYPMVYLFKVVQLMMTTALSKGKGTFTDAKGAKIKVPTFKEVPGELYVLTARLFETVLQKDPDKAAFMVDMLRGKIPSILSDALNHIRINGKGMMDFLFETMEIFQEAYKYDFEDHLDRQLNLKGAFTRGIALMNVFVRNRKTIALVHFNVLKKRAKTKQQQEKVAALGRMMQKGDLKSELKATGEMMKLTTRILQSELATAKKAHQEGGSALVSLFHSLHIVNDINNATDKKGKQLMLKTYDGNEGQYTELKWRGKPLGIATFVIREMLRFHVLTKDLRSKSKAGSAIDAFFDSIAEAIGIDLNEIVKLFTGIPTEAVEGVPAAAETGSLEHVGADDFDLDDFVTVAAEEVSDSDDGFLVIEDW